MRKAALTLAALAGAALFGIASPSAQAAPLASGLGALPAQADILPVQYREVTRFNRFNRRGQFCRVKVVRRVTPRGVVVRRVRNCM